MNIIDEEYETILLLPTSSTMHINIDSYYYD
jgi:hypothetical protein